MRYYYEDNKRNVMNILKNKKGGIAYDIFN